MVSDRQVYAQNQINTASAQLDSLLDTVGQLVGHSHWRDHLPGSDCRIHYSINSTACFALQRSHLVQLALHTYVEAVARTANACLKYVSHARVKQDQIQRATQDCMQLTRGQAMCSMIETVCECVCECVSE